MDQCAFLTSDSATSSLGSSRATSELPNSTSSIEPSQPLPRTDYPLIKKKSLHELSALLRSSTLIALRGWCSECSVEPVGPRNQKNSFINPLMDQFWCYYNQLLSMDLPTLRSTARAQSSCSVAFDGLLYDILQNRFPIKFLRKILNVRAVNFKASLRLQRAELSQQSISNSLADYHSIVDSWPRKLDESFILQRCAEYVSATTIKPPAPCICCGRAFLSHHLKPLYVFSLGITALPPSHPLLILLAEPTLIPSFTAPFSGLTGLLDGLMIFHKYAMIDTIKGTITLTFCHECESSISTGRLPRFSLRNNLFRGDLPPDLQDISWIEEKVCALHRVTADVARLHNAEQDERLPFRMVGNTCAHAADVPSTASILPRVPADINGHLTVVFVGKSFNKKYLPPIFRVRRRVIEKFLRFLAMSNPLYRDIPISEENLAMYPEDGLLPLLAESVIVSPPLHGTQSAQETASFEAHPASLVNPDIASVNPYSHATADDESSSGIIESTGVVDFDGSAISGQSALATAVFNLLCPRRETDLPDLILPRSQDPINEYNNPRLLPGMFPTLFPFGTGGLEAQRDSPISFQEHANYLLSLHDPLFKHHRLFLFVVLNIIKRRKAHLHTSFTVRKPSFAHIARQLASITAETLESTARHLESKGSFADMTPAQMQAYECLKQLNIVSVNIPGSPAAKIGDRASIRGYFGIFGLPHIYLTFNPPAAHSPILQVFFGDYGVDLEKQFPSLPFPEARAKRIAHDPAAAADFFVFAVKTFFRHLLGYDMDSKQSNGGILGHVKAYYGKCECTNRGCLHAHFVIWLLGGLNPRVVHEKLECDPDFKQRFFDFWEAVIKHDTPDTDLHISDEFEPRTQRPPPILQPDWESVFQSDVKACAEKLQRHTCQEVCWKYKNVSHLPRELRPCRFQFPHEIVNDSYYDSKTKSIVMACRDPTMNYYNPYVLVFCRHNHDIKNILSGKSAKAAMFYITNYITKDDLHSHHVLSMMSHTIAHMKESETASPVDRAKARLQRWLSQLSRLQEVHSQQAILYIRGVGDTFRSHETVPMLSYLLLMKVRSLFPEDIKESMLGDPPEDLNVPGKDVEAESEAGEVEDTTIALRRTSSGLFYTDSTHVDDYWHRADELSHLSFYEFVCCIRKEKKKGSTPTRLGSFSRYQLQNDHPQSSTHVLLQHQDPLLPLDLWKQPPRVIGMQVPRRDAKDYFLFMLSHFKPFSSTMPLKSPGECYADAFHSFEFPCFASTIMQNWEDVHECEDERDADRVRKKQADSQSAAILNAKLAAYAGADLDEDDMGPLVDLKNSVSHGSAELFQMVATLKDAGWLSVDNTPNPVAYAGSPFPKPSSEMIKQWANILKEQEANLQRERMNSSSALTQMSYSNFQNPLLAPFTTILPSSNTMLATVSAVPKTIAPQPNPQLETPDQVMQRIGNEMTLNQEQWTAYLIIGRKFIHDMIAHSNNEPPSPPVRLLLTGPGGTGKSHVVTTFKRLMAAYGMEHKLRLLAPTGSTAGVIDATTIHKGLGIRVSRKKANNTDTSSTVATIPKKRRLELELEWAEAEYIFCDECSMLGASLNAEFDQMLRLVKHTDTWYGGTNVVLAGDLAQFPPVRATPLFHPIGPKSGSKTNQDFLARLGRMAWKSFHAVVELKEQNRMKTDPTYAAAVGRLRLRKCTVEDVELFNSRVVHSYDNPGGVKLTPEESTKATTIVRDNRTRMHLNGVKASASSGRGEVIMCAARDFRRNGLVLEGAEREVHLMNDFASTIAQGGLPSFIPLAVGMDVVLRQRNISTELKIANGSMGVVVGLHTTQDGPYTFADGALVQFPASPIQLPGLPPHCIYLQPHSVAYQTRNGKKLEGFTRKQLQIEPAFAVTGHFSQGKTLPVVVADLKKGGYGAYVAASRPTSRNGLFLLKKVALRDLNSPPLPAELLKEMRRLDALRHNTLVIHGFLNANMKEVPDTEKESEALEKEHDELKESAGKRRKWPESKSGEEMQSVPAKRKRIDDVPFEVGGSHHPQTHSPPYPIYPHPYLKWNSTDYSCSYDSLITPLYFAWTSLGRNSRRVLAGYSPLLSQLLSMFESVFEADQYSRQDLLHSTRERLRDLLASSEHGNLFTRRGRAYAGMDDLFQVLGLQAQPSLRVTFQCIRCSLISGGEEIRSLHHMFYHGSTACLGNAHHNAVMVTVQEWINAQLSATRNDQRHICVHCQVPSQFNSIPHLSSPLPFISFHIQTVIPQLRPSLRLRIPKSGNNDYWEYKLGGVIYYGAMHFTARMLSEEVCWEYDGMRGQPVFVGPVSETSAFLNKLLDFSGHIITHLLYVLQDP